MANSYIPRWQNISVDFNDANSMMKNAMTGISEAGTVFDKMRQGILDEEQRAIENARAAEAAALAQDTLNEEIRANQALEEYRAGQLANEKERIEMQGKLNESEIARNNALIRQTNARINQDETNKRAWQLAVKAVDALSPKFQDYDNLLKAQAVTREAFDNDKRTKGDKSIYKDYADYDTFQASNTAKIADHEKWLKENNINKADFTGLGTAHGRVNILEKAFIANGGFGPVKDYLSIADANGLVYEAEKMKQDAASKADFAKKERDLATPGGIDAQLKPYAMNDDARNALNQLALTLITNKGNSTLSNQDILNDLITQTVLPGVDVNAITRAYRYFRGNPSISFKTKEDLDAALVAAGLKTSSGLPDNPNGGNSGSAANMFEKTRTEVAANNPDASFNEIDELTQQTMRKRQSDINRETTKKLNSVFQREKLAKRIPTDILSEFGITDVTSTDYNKLFPVMYKLGLDINDFTNSRELRNAYTTFKMSQKPFFR